MILEAMSLDLFWEFMKKKLIRYKLREKILKVSIMISDQRFILKMDASQPPKVQSIEKWIDMQKSSELKERS